ncbi:hypothetical protein EDD11_003330 [Mortierella claussenii]|nr:hypothetical protein EDD11_003330 [Mortierella claussenii]
MQARRNLLAARRDLLTALQASQSSATVVDLDDFESLLMQMTRLRIDLDNERDSWNETRSTLQRRQQHADTLIDDHGFMYDWSLDRDGDDDFNFDYRDFEGDNNDDDDDDDDDNDDGGGSYPHYRDDGFDNVHDISEWGIPVWTELE